MHKFGLCAILFTAAVTVPAVAQGATDGRLYQCAVKSQAAPRLDGSLGPDEETTAFTRIKSRFVFDTSTQLLRWADSNLGWQYKKVKDGDANTSLIALRVYEGPATQVVNLLQIEIWRKGWPFLLIEQHIVYTGLCEKF